MADERDPWVSQRYRELGDAQPPRELDQAILAAAHRAADRPHAPLVTPAGRHRWYFSLAAAAVLMLAVGIALHIERQQPDPEAVSLPEKPATQPSAQVAKERRDAPQSAAAAPPAAHEAEKKPANAALKKEKRDAAEGSRPAAQPAEPPAGQTDRLESAPAQRRAEMSSAAPELRAMRKPAPAARAPAASNYLETPAETPERELERIAELRKLGRDDEADKALAEFRKRYPDYRIAEEMRAKVERPGPAR